MFIAYKLYIGGNGNLGHEKATVHIAKTSAPHKHVEMAQRRFKNVYGVYPGANWQALQAKDRLQALEESAQIPL